MHHQIVPHPDRRKVEFPLVHSDCGTHTDMVPNYLIWGLKPYRESLQATERRLDLEMGQGVKPE